MESDSIWEYNAPQYVDFTRPEEDGSDADEYFEIDHENQALLESKNNSLNKSNRSAKNQSISQSDEQMDCDKDDPTPVNGQDHTVSGSVGNNICTSLEQWRSKQVSKKDALQPADSTSAKRVTRQSAKAIKTNPANRAERENLAGRHSLNRSAAKESKQRSSCASASTKNEELNVSQDKAMLRKRRLQEQNGAESSTATPTHRATMKKPKLTMPNTPSFLKRDMKFLHVNRPMNSEALELNRIKALRRSLAHKRKLAAESCAKALNPVKYEPIHSGAPLTKPKVFNFATDTRFKGTETVTEFKGVDFAAQLRKHKDQAAVVPHGPTVPQPFNFHSTKPSTEGYHPEDGRFETMAEKVSKFSSKTPERFHSKPRTSYGTEAANMSGSNRRSRDPAEPKITIPKTPNLMTRARARPVTVTSQAEKEELELKEIKEHQFKAQPLNHKIFQNPNIGIKKVASKESTVPEEFDLEIERRLAHRKKMNDSDAVTSTADESHQFHAKPVPTKILQGVVGVKPAKEIPLTIPQSPQFATKYALRNHVRKQEPEVEKVTIKAAPVPNFATFHPVLEKRVVEVAPFSFDSRDKEIVTRKEELIKKVLDEEKQAREFHANPLPDLNPVLPPKIVKPVTQPEPFNLEIDQRGERRQREWTRKIEEERRMEREAATFKARPPSVLEKEPFVPEKSCKPHTGISSEDAVGFQLNTERRAEERQEWEKWSHEKETEAEYERAEREKRRLEEEEQQVRRLRAEAVPKAQPIRHYRPVQIQPSSQPLTYPESPKFSDRLRSKTLRN